MASKFEIFAALHVPGNPVVLYNVWDVGSALAVSAAGAKALATGSHPVADANGWPDGQHVPIDFALANAKRIVDAVELPVTIDFEGAYSTDPDEGGRNIARLAHTGAVGCNFEDQVVGGEGLHSLTLQCSRIEAIRNAVGDRFFINARTDMFLKAPRAEHDEAMADAAIERAKGFADSGASGLFVPGLINLKLLKRVCEASPLPVNAIAAPGGPTKFEYESAGVARISHGPFPHRALMRQFEEMARAAIA